MGTEGRPVGLGYTWREGGSSAYVLTLLSVRAKVLFNSSHMKIPTGREKREVRATFSASNRSEESTTGPTLVRLLRIVIKVLCRSMDNIDHVSETDDAEKGLVGQTVLFCSSGVEIRLRLNPFLPLFLFFYFSLFLFFSVSHSPYHSPHV